MASASRRRLLVVLALAAAGTLVPLADASALVPVEPAEGAAVSPAPVLAWSLGVDERSERVTVSPQGGGAPVLSRAVGPRTTTLAVDFAFERGSYVWQVTARRMGLFPVTSRAVSFVVDPAIPPAPAPELPPAAERASGPCVEADYPGVRCPDLAMSRPSQLRLQRYEGRRVLRSRTSLNSVGTGPIELHGRRTGRRTMRITQRIHRTGGRPLAIPVSGRLAFKAIPGQGGYWKLHDAARMEVWSLGASGRPARRVRTSPKLLYCLRDLFRTRGRLPGSPRRRIYPRCNQQPGRRSVRLGTSVGWSDIYPAPYYEQYVDVTGLRGRFALVHFADPSGHLHESDETNNASMAIVRL